MAEPISSASQIATLGGLGALSISLGLDPAAVIAAFGGALLFAFMAKNTSAATRLFGLVGAWIFGCYAAVEIVKRKVFGFESPPLPAFVSAFFCVAIFKMLLALFEEEGRAWVRKRLGLPPGGQKVD